MAHQSWDEEYDEEESVNAGGSVESPDEEETACCPLCLEELDLTDVAFHPCKCGYQICLWCYHQLMNAQDAKCPACRSPFVAGGVQASALVAPRALAAAAHAHASAAQLQLRKKNNINANKERQTSAPPMPSHGKDMSAQLVPITGAGLTPLSDVRIVQRNLAYVVGLSSACGREELLRKREWFGGFGKTHKVAVSKTFGGPGGSHAPTFAAYITYKEVSAAAEAIRQVNHGQLGILLAKGGQGAGGQPDSEQPRARASYGTTKYCASWLRGSSCTKNNCLYLHALAPLEDCCTKDQLQRDRFEERFGMGKKSTGVQHQHVTTAAPPAPSAAAAVAQPPEMLRAHSTPASYSSATAAHTMSQPRPLSFASVAQQQQSHQPSQQSQPQGISVASAVPASSGIGGSSSSSTEPTSSPPPNPDELSEFPPLQASPDSALQLQQQQQAAAALRSKHASPIKQLSARANSPAAPQRTQSLQTPAPSPAPAPAPVAEPAAPAPTPAATVAAPLPSPPQPSPENAQALEALFSRPMHPISSLQPSPPLGGTSSETTILPGLMRGVSAPLEVVGGPMGSHGLSKPTIRPPPGFREKPPGFPAVPPPMPSNLLPPPGDFSSSFAPPQSSIPSVSSSSSAASSSLSSLSSMTAVPLANAPIVHSFPAMFGVGGLSSAAAANKFTVAVENPLLGANGDKQEDDDERSWDQRYSLQGIGTTSVGSHHGMQGGINAISGGGSMHSSGSGSGVSGRSGGSLGSGSIDIEHSTSWLQAKMDELGLSADRSQSSSQPPPLQPAPFDTASHHYGMGGSYWQPQQMAPSFSTMHGGQEHMQQQHQMHPSPFSQHMQQQQQQQQRLSQPPSQSRTPPLVPSESGPATPSESPSKLGRSRYNFASSMESQQQQQQQQQQGPSSWDSQANEYQSHSMQQSQQQQQPPQSRPMQSSFPPHVSMSPPRGFPSHGGQSFQMQPPPQSQQQQQHGGYGFRPPQQQQQPPQSQESNSSCDFQMHHSYMQQQQQQHQHQQQAHPQQPPQHQLHPPGYSHAHGGVAPPIVSPPFFRPHLRPPLVSSGASASLSSSASSASASSSSPAATSMSALKERTLEQDMSAAQGWLHGERIGQQQGEEGEGEGGEVGETEEERQQEEEERRNTHHQQQQSHTFHHMRHQPPPHHHLHHHAPMHAPPAQRLMHQHQQLQTEFDQQQHPQFAHPSQPYEPLQLPLFGRPLPFHDDGPFVPPRLDAPDDTLPLTHIAHTPFLSPVVLQDDAAFRRTEDRENETHEPEEVVEEEEEEEIAQPPAPATPVAESVTPPPPVEEPHVEEAPSAAPTVPIVAAAPSMAAVVAAAAAEVQKQSKAAPAQVAPPKPAAVAVREAKKHAPVTAPAPAPTVQTPVAVASNAAPATKHPAAPSKPQAPQVRSSGHASPATIEAFPAPSKAGSAVPSAPATPTRNARAATTAPPRASPAAKTTASNPAPAQKQEPGTKANETPPRASTSAGADTSRQGRQKGQAQGQAAPMAPKVPAPAPVKKTAAPMPVDVPPTVESRVATSMPEVRKPAQVAVVDAPVVVKEPPPQPPQPQQQSRRKKKQPVSQNRPSTPPPPPAVVVTPPSPPQKQQSEKTPVPPAPAVVHNTGGKKKHGGKGGKGGKQIAPAGSSSASATSLSNQSGTQPKTVPSSNYVLSTTHINLPPDAPIFLSPRVSPAAVVSALATTAPPPSVLTSSSALAPSFHAGDFSEVHHELLHLAALVRAGALPQLELQSVLLSLVQVPGVPSMDLLLQQADEQLSKIRVSTTGKLKEPTVAAEAEEEEKRMDEDSTPPPPPTSDSHVSPSVSGCSYPNLLVLRHDAALASYYDHAYRSWEHGSPVAHALCKEVFVLTQRLALERREERARKGRMEDARDKLEEGLMLGMGVEEDEEVEAEAGGRSDSPSSPSSSSTGHQSSIASQLALHRARTAERHRRQAEEDFEDDIRLLESMAGTKMAGGIVTPRGIETEEEAAAAAAAAAAAGAAATKCTCRCSCNRSHSSPTYSADKEAAHAAHAHVHQHAHTHALALPAPSDA